MHHRDRRLDGPRPTRHICVRHRVLVPARYPSQSRPEMALRLPPTVAERDGELLLCGCEHEGDHQWPDDGPT
jgi:hypothetical protein